MRDIIPIKSAQFGRGNEEHFTVALPHTWNNLDGQDGGNDYWRGEANYKISLPDPTKGKKQYIQFEGANHIATVKCNGVELGVHKGGFSTFRFELTNQLKDSGNELEVIVSNAPSDIYPQNADFTFFGGLYRNVAYIEVEPAHFDLNKHGTSGVFVTPRAGGKVRIDAFPVDSEGCQVRCIIRDAEGKDVATTTVPAIEHTVLIANVENAHLWNGLDDPYCYSVVASILGADGTELDTVIEHFGFRSFHVDPERGFFLNGKSYPLHGVSRHQDRLDKGWAISHADHEEDLALIKEVGANTIRLAHYQHDQYFYSICDQAGMVLWAEIPFISSFIPSKEAYDNTISQMTELVAQNYNHPAICFWGISNEITISGENEALLKNLQDLNTLVKKLDPSRLTTMAEVSMVPKNSDHVYITDVLSYNHYFGWYVGDAEDNGPWLDKFHEMNPDRCLGVSEYGSEAITTWHSAKPENHDYTEEYAAQYHHDMLKTFATRPYLWSTHVWNMFDFAADARDEGGVKGRNNKGLVTYDRKIKKDGFYIYKAYWTKEPMIHVCGERFVDRAPDERSITVYTNCASVTLVVNGIDVAKADAVDHSVVFKDVELNSGANTVTAKYENVEANTITLNAVDTHNREYDLPAGEGDAGNWFDAEPLQYPEGYYSIKDKISDLMANPETAKIVGELMSNIKGGALSMMEGSLEDNPMKEFMMMMRLDNMMKMAGDSVSLETKRSLNEQLTKIKK
jgi:beta-galactosidase